MPPHPPEPACAPDDDPNGRFVQSLNAHHRKLLGYLVSLVGHRADAEDVLQRASITMWRKFSTFAPGTDFMAWASTIAFYEAKNFLRLSGRHRVPFDDALLDLLALERTRDLGRQEARLDALRGCLEKLDPAARELVRGAYEDDVDMIRLAARVGRAPQTVYNRLHLIRRSLARCVELRLEPGKTA
jgi:RNA polymerase sigma-70 factor (ECF subfamily)